MIDWDGHANLEFAASSYVVFYLFDYICKGNRKVQLVLNNVSDLHEEDEINIFLRGRMLTSMDAVWRTFGYRTYPAPQPSVRLIKAKLPNDLQFMLREGKLSDLYVYFQRPISLHHLKYAEFFTYYCYKYTLNQQRFLNDNAVFDENGNLRFCYIEPQNGIKGFYIYKRSRPNDCITRISGVPPDAGEIWYLRMLLREYPAVSYQDILSCDGRIYSSFQEVAYEKGLLTDDREAMYTFQEALLYESPAGLRFIFSLLTMQGFPTLNIYNDLELRERMYVDYIRSNTPAGIAEAEQRLLEDFHDRFTRENKNLENYGLPKPLLTRTELEREQEIIGNENTNTQWLQELLFQMPNTEEMDVAYNSITSAIRNEESKFVFIRGCGGSGKTQFAKKV